MFGCVRPPERSFPIIFPVSWLAAILIRNLHKCGTMSVYFSFARDAYSYFLIKTNYFSRICTWTVAVWVELLSHIIASLNNRYVAYLRRNEFPTIKIIYVHGYVQCLLGCFSFCKQPPQWHETIHRFASLANTLAKQSPS